MVVEKTFKLTIVVAIYNIAEELPELLIQMKKLNSNSGLEVLLVDDGSTDDTSEILSDFYQYNNNPNFRIIKRNNGGLSATRNQGLMFSQGDYVWFVDGDDIIDPLFVDQLLVFIEERQPDFIQFYYRRFTKIRDIKFLPINNKIKNYEYLTTNQWFSKLVNVKEKQFENYSWAHIVKRSIYIKNNIIFPIKRNYEDVATTFKLANSSDEIVIIKEIGYFYRDRLNSITNNYSEKNCRDLLIAIAEFSVQKSLDFSEKDQANFAHRYIVGAYYMANKLHKNRFTKLKRTIRKQLLENKFSNLTFRFKVEYLLFYFEIYDFYRDTLDMIKKHVS